MSAVSNQYSQTSGQARGGRYDDGAEQHWVSLAAMITATFTPVNKRFSKTPYTEIHDPGMVAFFCYF